MMNFEENFKEFTQAERDHPYAANRILFKWLSDDDDRAALYQHLCIYRPVLKFQSRADTKLRPTDPGDSRFRQDVYLLTARADIEKALKDTTSFSNAPYRALGGGTFMLALDGEEHKTQRAFASAYLRHVGNPPGKGREDEATIQAFGAYLRENQSTLDPHNKTQETDGAFADYLDGVDAQTIVALAEVAFLAAAVLPLKRRQFDLVELAEQAALRYAGFLFGFAQADHPLLEASMRAAYLGLNYQILGRHFVTEPGILPEAIKGMGALLKRTAYLLDLYREPIGSEQQDELEAIGDELKDIRNYKDRSGRQPLQHFVPLLRKIARHAATNVQDEYSGTELAVMVVGMIAGTIGNVQASVAIAINQFFRGSDASDRGELFESARDAAGRSRQGGGGAADLENMIWEALRLNPPVAFLPRKTIKSFLLGNENIPPNSILILAMGSATREGLGNSSQFGHERNHHDPLIFGGLPGAAGYAHQCIGEHLAMPLIVHIVRQILLLDGLAERLDPLSGKPLGLQKLWGFNCRSYALEFNRFDVVKQSPLNVAMKIKTPVSEHAEELKKIIKYGAPRIEQKLRDARHVHFAWFEFIENDSKLVLHTVYDRDFDTYIEHFALQIGPLFDLLFEHIQDAPPLPVSKFPKEFVDTIRRYNARPAGDYFFSAYPSLEVAMVTNQLGGENT